MTETPGELLELREATFGAIGSRIAYEVLDSKTPSLRHVVGIDVEHGLQVREIDEADLQAIPRRPKGDRTVADLDSFLAELERRPLSGVGTLWGNAVGGVLHAVYNDHEDDVIGGWRDDRLVLKLTKDEDWTAWHGISGKYLPQEQFGDIIEELLHTVIDPDQADLLEIIDSVRASTSGEFESKIERSNGAQNLVYKTEVTTSAGRTGQLEVPQTITLSLRPWEGHIETYDIEAWFRVRVANGQLALAVKLKPTRQIVRQAWADLTAKVTEAVGKPVYAQ